MRGVRLRRNYKFGFPLLLCVFLIAGCGYDLEGARRPERLKNVRTISIPAFLNNTNEPGLERAVTKSVKNRFLRDGRLRVSDSPDADIILEGVLREYRLSPIGFTQADRVKQYRVVVRTRIRLRDRERQKLLINQDLESNTEFAVSSSIVQSATNRSNANRRVADSLSRDIVSLVLEDF